MAQQIHSLKNTHLNEPSRAVVYVACLSKPADKPCSQLHSLGKVMCIHNAQLDA